ncbi:hypothetical protein [Kyrpidia spormannii]|uniref:Uncharacterized protein n=2 Tax=Kyrpidia spormannii TaxID=2055160 RepID=A0ACA8ZD48_9BACL|nr:hypothetical protein [Kyrpidia spormannii]CAB3395004.1 protein of unknown function [Kyrpidia spormannii]CAB3395936.1 protein of unknown function [Kyrpidia spormannii]
MSARGISVVVLLGEATVFSVHNIGIAYAVASWLTMALITGILAGTGPGGRPFSNHPHCGLLACLQRPAEPGNLLGRDFLLGHTVGALAGWYVIDAGIRTLCCKPQVLQFGERDDAERFVRGFGGRSGTSMEWPTSSEGA